MEFFKNHIFRLFRLFLVLPFLFSEFVAIASVLLTSPRVRTEVSAYCPKYGNNLNTRCVNCYVCNKSKEKCTLDCLWGGTSNYGVGPTMSWHCSPEVRTKFFNCLKVYFRVTFGFRADRGVTLSDQSLMDLFGSCKIDFILLNTVHYAPDILQNCPGTTNSRAWQFSPEFDSSSERKSQSGSRKVI